MVREATWTTLARAMAAGNEADGVGVFFPAWLRYDLLDQHGQQVLTRAEAAGAHADKGLIEAAEAGGGFLNFQSASWLLGVVQGLEFEC